MLCVSNKIFIQYFLTKTCFWILTCLIKVLLYIFQVQHHASPERIINYFSLYIYLSYFESKQDLWIVHIHILLHVSEYIRFGDKWIFHIDWDFRYETNQLLIRFSFKKIAKRNKIYSIFLESVSNTFICFYSGIRKLYWMQT